MVKHIPAHQQIADIFTKSLPTAAFQSLRFKLGVNIPPTPSLRGDISELSSTQAQVQTSSVSPSKARLTREEKAKAKMFEEDKLCASFQSKSDSMAPKDQRSLSVGFSKSKLHEKTETKAGTDGAFSVKLANALSVLDGASDTG